MSAAGLAVPAVVQPDDPVVLGRRNLSWTWALLPTALSAFGVWATLIESWSVALVGGLLTAREPEGEGFGPSKRLTDA